MKPKQRSRESEREGSNSARHEADDVEGDSLLLYGVIIIHRDTKPKRMSEKQAGG